MTAATAATSPEPEASEKQLTCFVVTGFGRKTDFATGRVLDLDKTFEQLVRPAFDRVNINAFRAIDANLTGSIDSIMYQWLYEADIVIADLSTLNANVFYELGVRHAQKPNTTVIIAESVLMSKIPFDLSSFVIHAYEHAGDKIAEEEQERFVDHLAKLLQDILENEKKRLAVAPDSERENDSPIYTFLPGMRPPQFSFEKHLAPPAYVPPEKRDRKQPDEGESLASIIEAAEDAKTRNEFDECIKLFTEAIDKSGKEKPDIFLAQRLALVTYKAGEKETPDGSTDKEAAVDALLEAEEILKKYCAPKISTDPETLGLSGAINKRLYALTDDTEYLDRAIAFYERGFYVKQDYYNGINVAFMYNIKANLTADRFQAIVYYGHANIIRKKVAGIVQEIIDDEESFSKLPDKEKQWVYMTQAEAYQGMGLAREEARLAKTIEKVGTEFGKKTYKAQKAKLQQAIDEFNLRVRPEDLAQPADRTVALTHTDPSQQVEEPVEADASDAESTATTPAAPATGAADSAAPLQPVSETMTRRRVSPQPGSGVIVVDADIVKGKPIKSVQVNCKIEYVD